MNDVTHQNQGAGATWTRFMVIPAHKKINCAFNTHTRQYGEAGTNGRVPNWILVKEGDTFCDPVFARHHKAPPPTFFFDGTTKPNKTKRDSLSPVVSFFRDDGVGGGGGSSSQRQYGRKNKSREK